MSLFYTNSNTFLHHNSYISLKSPKNNFLTPKYCHKITQKKYSPFLSLSHTHHTHKPKRSTSIQTPIFINTNLSPQSAPSLYYNRHYSTQTITTIHQLSCISFICFSFTVYYYCLFCFLGYDDS